MLGRSSCNQSPGDSRPAINEKACRSNHDCEHFTRQTCDKKPNEFSKSPVRTRVGPSTEPYFHFDARHSCQSTQHAQRADAAKNGVYVRTISADVIQKRDGPFEPSKIRCSRARKQRQAPLQWAFYNAQSQRCTRIVGSLTVTFRQVRGTATPPSAARLTVLPHNVIRVGDALGGPRPRVVPRS